MFRLGESLADAIQRQPSGSRRLFQIRRSAVVEEHRLKHILLVA
jgi:hypothetical protein